MFINKLFDAGQMNRNCLSLVLLGSMLTITDFSCYCQCPLLGSTIAKLIIPLLIE